MATDTLLKIPQEDEIEFTVFVKAASAGQEGQEMVALQFTFGEGLEVNIQGSGVELSDTQAERLGNLTTKYVGDIAGILANIN
jgi:hypothetical protein